MTSTNQRWVVDSGILRKQKRIGDEETQQLLIFGYSCKLFRDDEKAKLIDQGKHLIPWMGDSTLKIDRYDGRGALGDLSVYEPPPGGYDIRTILTEDEYKVEQACDEERYKSLYNNEIDEAMYQEEEIKRLHQALDDDKGYSQVGFNYDDENKNLGEDSQSPRQSEDSQEDDQVYVPDPRLELPENIVVPETMKLHAIILKTAVFISQQGSQMEILIRTKQANNSQFNFLTVGEELYPYYKHVLEAIKSGKYNPDGPADKSELEEKEKEEESNEDSDDDSYLHPSLASSLARVEAAPSIPSIAYKPSADCAYSMLVNKIAGIPNTYQNQEQIHPPQPEQPQHQQLPAQSNQIKQPQLPAIITMQPPYQTPESVPSQMPTFFQPMTNYPQYQPPPQQYAQGPVLYTENNILPPLPHPAPRPPMLNPEIPVQKEIVPLVPYGTPPSKPLTRPSFIVPPADIQIIIDKMASYVAKNGRDFEAIVKSKGDPRFNFLELSHQYHGYYVHKLTIYEGAVNPKVLTDEELLQRQEMQEEKMKKLAELQKKKERMEEVQKRVKMIQEKKKEEIETKLMTPVSFSIKKVKDGEINVVDKPMVFPAEESDDGESSVHKNDSNVEKTNSETVVIKSNENMDPNNKREDVNNTNSSVNSTNDSNDNDCALDFDLEEKLMAMKEKLAASALKETLKEKQLQLERRKKAAMFLSQIQTNAPSHGNQTPSPIVISDKEDFVLQKSPPRKCDDDEAILKNKAYLFKLKKEEYEKDYGRKKHRSRSRSKSPHYSQRHKSHRKHKKKKSSHKSDRDYENNRQSSSRLHKYKKSKKSSHHRSHSPSPSYHRYHSSHRHHYRKSSSSDSSTDSD